MTNTIHQRGMSRAMRELALLSIFYLPFVGLAVLQWFLFTEAFGNVGSIIGGVIGFYSFSSMLEGTTKQPWEVASGRAEGSRRDYLNYIREHLRAHYVWFLRHKILTILRGIVGLQLLCMVLWGLFLFGVV